MVKKRQERKCPHEKSCKAVTGSGRQVFFFFFFFLKKILIIIIILYVNTKEESDTN